MGERKREKEGKREREKKKEKREREKEKRDNYDDYRNVRGKCISTETFLLLFFAWRQISRDEISSL
jgi:hypothetical protein